MIILRVRNLMNAIHQVGNRNFCFKWQNFTQRLVGSSSTMTNVAKTHIIAIAKHIYGHGSLKWFALVAGAKVKMDTLKESRREY